MVGLTNRLEMKFTEELIDVGTDAAHFGKHAVLTILAQLSGTSPSFESYLRAQVFKEPAGGPLGPFA